MKRTINPLLLAGIIGTAVFGSMFAGEYGVAVWGDQNIWWPPLEMALPLPATANDFEAHVGGLLLQQQAELGALAVKDEKGTMRPVAPSEIRVRLNNWQRIRAERLHGAVFAALSSGISLACLAIEAWRRRCKIEKNRSAS
jgi:hypothetical protein